MKIRKKIFTAVIAFMLFIVSATVFYVYWTNYRGLWSAITPPKENIAELIEKAQKPPEALIQGENKTEFPLTIPAGFSISIFAKNLNNPRVLEVDPTGTLLVSIPKQGKVIALPDEDTDGKADEVITVAEKLNQPHGIAFYQANLYIAESHQVARYAYDPATKKASNKEKILDLPDGGRHFTRTILFKDDILLTAVGSSCDTCIESDWRRASILQSKPDGSALKTFA